MSRSHDDRSGRESTGDPPGPAYQPIVDLRSGIVAGFEAVPRAPRDPQLGAGGDPPMAVQVAWLEVALAGADVLPNGAWLSIAVPTDLISADGPLRAVLAQRDRPIVLELSECDRVEDYDALRTAIAALGPHVAIAVDHAGRGDESFPHATELRPRFVKLDPALTHRIDADATQQLLVAGLRKVAVGAGSRLIAVGVETAAERATLLSLGIELGQGTLLGRPAAAASWAVTRARQGDGSALQRWLGRR